MPKANTQKKKSSPKITEINADSFFGKKYSMLFVMWLSTYLILLSFFFRTLVRNNTYKEIFPIELILPLTMNAVTAILIALSIFWIPKLKTFIGKLIAASVLALFMLNYTNSLSSVIGTIQAFTPGLNSGDNIAIPSLIYLAIVYCISIIIGVFAEKFITLKGHTHRIKMRDVELGFFIFVAYLFIVPAFTIVKAFPSLLQETSFQTQTLEKPKGASKTIKEKPDVYYIVLDRYANDRVLKNQFGYDNSEFRNFLEGKGYSVNQSARSNYPYTTMSISSTMNADYTKKYAEPYKDKEVQSSVLYHHLIQKSSVVKAFKQEGYKYYAIGANYGASYKNPLSDRDYMSEHSLSILGKAKRLRGIEASEFTRSPYYTFAQVPYSWWPMKISSTPPVDYIRKQLNELTSISSKEEPGGRFIFAHILVPHYPYYFNPDGSLATNPTNDSTGKHVKDKYIDQVKFINNELVELIENIHSQSNNKAVVLLNADEGPWPQHMTDTFKTPAGSTPKVAMQNWSDEWLNMKFGIQQSVHIPNATTEDLSKLSSVNLFRIVLNRYAGYDMDYLPQCHFSIDEGTPQNYIYKDITKRLESSPDKSCEKLQNLPTKK